MPRRKGAKKAAPVVESPIVDELYDDEGFGAEAAAAAAAVAASAAAAAAAGNDPDEAILEAAARSAVAGASDGKFLVRLGPKLPIVIWNFLRPHMCLFWLGHWMCLFCSFFADTARTRQKIPHPMRSNDGANASQCPHRSMDPTFVWLAIKILPSPPITS